MVQACPHDCLIASLYATRIIVATHMQLRSIRWLLTKWRAGRERTILVLDEGQHILKSALSMVEDSVSLKAVEKAAKEAGKHGFRDLEKSLEGLLKPIAECCPRMGRPRSTTCYRMRPTSL